MNFDRGTQETPPPSHLENLAGSAIYSRGNCLMMGQPAGEITLWSFLTRVEPDEAGRDFPIP
jgi:hypothetical protein